MNIDELIKSIAVYGFGIKLISILMPLWLPFVFVYWLINSVIEFGFKIGLTVWQMLGIIAIIALINNLSKNF